MKILVKGMLKETPVKCDDCDTIFSYNRDDINEGHIPSPRLKYVICPVCKRKHFIK